MSAPLNFKFNMQTRTDKTDNNILVRRFAVADAPDNKLLWQ